MAKQRLTRMTLDEAMARTPTFDRARLDATTEEDIRRQMVEDGEDPDEVLRVEDCISPAVIRKRLGLSQAEFARLLAIPLGTLRNWEQNRTPMEPATVALMTILAREPEAALRALRRDAA